MGSYIYTRINNTLLALRFQNRIHFQSYTERSQGGVRYFTFEIYYSTSIPVVMPDPCVLPLYIFYLSRKNGTVYMDKNFNILPFERYILLDLSTRTQNISTYRVYAYIYLHIIDLNVQ